MPQFQIANEIAQIYKSTYGRGPTRVVAHLLRDTVVCVLEDVLTQEQAALVELGEFELVDTVHGRIRRALAPEFVGVVESVTGRQVRCYVPGFDARQATATDTFLLRPEDGREAASPSVALLAESE